MKLVLKLDLHDKDKSKALRIVSGLAGVNAVVLDMNVKMLTVIGTVDPVRVVSKLRKFWHTEIVSVGPAKEPAKKEEKKEEGKKDEPKKEGKKEEANKKEEKKELGPTDGSTSHRPYHPPRPYRPFFYPQPRTYPYEENRNACTIF
ncbi:heavy metal-associated isoprenylated plant protein 39-like isoform X2 [Diospyros lotus]|uniref:heavy metal-associated isoprenylated plant protein 39-like isoform X2 n=1 Tax=Diospyros lotus TaxID=55363 RepID=UPI00225967FB|nr:heavy metal-associated isoprenylated plant protein 39-like isoform X2 [Diospyros lotus]